MSKFQCVHLFDCVEKDCERCPNDVYNNTSYCEVHQNLKKRDEKKIKERQKELDDSSKRVKMYLIKKYE